jgi:plasmid stabilization system protein ParE
VNIRFLTPAQKEIDDAVDWYNKQTDGLGQGFLNEIDRCVRRIVTFPLSGAEIAPSIRRCFRARFPYGIIYGIEEQTIIVLAIAHLHRKPRYWIERMQ